MEHVLRSYGALADTYIDMFGSAAAVPEAGLNLITRHLDLRPGTVLDVGCGPGHLTDHLRSLGVAAVGLDLVPEFVRHARATYQGGRYLLGSMDRLPIADGSVAGLLSWFSLIHMEPNHLDGVLSELRRVAAPGGVLVAGFFDGDQLAPFDHKVTTAYFWPAGRFSARMALAGFSEIERVRWPGDPERGRRPSGVIVATAE